MKSRKRLWIFLPAVFCSLVHAGEFRALSQACEEALALSAMPEALRQNANVYVWQDADFKKTVSSDGGFHCLVERNHNKAIIPQCVSPSGKDSILQGLMFRTKQAAKGLPPNKMQEKLKAAFASGKLIAPKEPGINYMMSAYNYIYVQNSDSFRQVPPHNMFFAPNTTNEMIGGSWELATGNKGYPFVIESGPHGYMITFTEQAAEIHGVVEHCEGEIDYEPVNAGS
ncbi:MAG: hypothetical protein AAF438_11200 [Pseudomonadota bacterium]